MGFFDDVLNIIGKVVNVVMYAAGTVVGITVAGAVEFCQVAYEKYGEYRAKNRSVNLALANKPVHHLTSNINDEITELERKKNRDRSLNQNDNQSLNSLYAQRDKLKDEVRKNSELFLIEKMQAGKGVYDSIHINNVNTHILQFHVGQTVFGKRCRQCGRPMILQWKQGMQTVAMSEFFWGCIGFYEGVRHNEWKQGMQTVAMSEFFWGCIGFYEGVRHNEPFMQSDMDLFTRIDRPEFEVTSRELGNIIQMPGPKANITKRMRGIKQEVTDVYLCPVHNEPMVLREKKDAHGLLDQYFFGCPRWLQVKGGCSQIVKLKSPAQLASALEAFYGRGIL